jgi:hypothetical protein
MSSYIFKLILICYLILFNNYSLANYNNAIDNYNNQKWYEARIQCESELEDFRCINLLGVLYLNGLGVEINYVKAKNNFISAKKLGSRSAVFNLGWMALKGLGEDINLDSASKYFNNYNSNDISVIKNKDNIKNISKDNLIKLKKNNLISKYGFFYINYIKLEILFKSKINIEEKIITNIVEIENKLKQFDNILIQNNANITSIRDNILKEQEIIIKLLKIEIDKDLKKFEKTITDVYSVLQNYEINKI